MIGPPFSVCKSCRSPRRSLRLAALRRLHSPLSKHVCASVVIGVVLLVLPPSATGVGLMLTAVWLSASLVYFQTRSDLGPADAVDLAGRYLEAGNLATAAELLSRTASSDDTDSDCARAALALIHLRQGHPGNAVWLLSTLLGKTQLRCSVARHRLENALTYAYAVGGALGVATQRSRMTGLGGGSPLVSCLLLCKRGRFNDVDALSNPTDGPPGWHGKRVFALLRAFACRRVASADASALHRVDALLAVARPTHAREYDYLRDGWPELEAFIEEYADQLRVGASDYLSVELPRASARNRR